MQEFEIYSLPNNKTRYLNNFYKYKMTIAKFHLANKLIQNDYFQ